MAAGVNPVETYIRAGKYARLPALPFTPGAEGAGIVEAVGEDVKTVQVGDRVYVTGSGTGTYAQYCRTSSAAVQPLPDNISFREGAAIPVAYRTAYRALFLRAHARAGRWLFVHGASGGVGLATLQLGVAHGMKVIGSASSDAGRDLIAAQGATPVNHASKGYMDKVLELTGGSGIDVLVELLANVNLGHDLKILARGGVVAVVGSRGPVEINPRDLMLKEASVVGVLGGTDAEIAECFAGINAGLRSGALRPAIDKSFSLARAMDAHQQVIEHSGGSVGKIILTPWEDADASDSHAGSE